MEALLIQPVRERIAEMLRKAIFDGTLQPGQELKQAELAEQLGVSRIPVREALLMLERDGLIVVHGNRRATVAEITEANVRDHYDIRSMLEGEAAARASRHPDAHSPIEEAQQVLERAASEKQASAYVQANYRFHSAIWEAAKSAQLANVLNNLWKGLPIHLPELLPELQMERSVAEHRRILDALKAGDGETARRAMVDHVLRSLNDFLQARKTSP